jgi:tetratricopeptide (TPR) repeat protein
VDARRPSIIGSAVVTTPTSIAATPTPPWTEIERRVKWRALPAIIFLGIMVVFGIVALMPDIFRRAPITGLPDDADILAARELVAGRLALGSGTLRFRSSLLGEGAVAAALTAEDDLALERAFDHLDRARRRHLRDHRIVAAQAALELAAGRLDRAEVRYRTALLGASAYGEARLGLGTCLALMAERETQPLVDRGLRLRAIAQFAAVPEDDPLHTLALYDRAVLLMRVGRADEARRFGRAYLERDPSDPWAGRLTATLGPMR